MKNQNLELSVQRSLPLPSITCCNIFFTDQKISILFSTPRGGRFSRAPPFVARNKAVHEIAYYQPCSRIWRPAPILPRATLLDTGTKPLSSRGHSSPEQALNPETRLESVPDSEKPYRKGGLSDSTSRRMRGESGQDASTKPA